MSLQDKYAELIDAARTAGVSNLQVRDSDNVLYIDGVAPSAAIKDELWNIYGRLDPDYRAADLVMNLEVTEAETPGFTEYTIEKGDSLSKIGAKFGKNWRDIYELNREKIGDNPDYIQAGWVIKIPG